MNIAEEYSKWMYHLGTEILVFQIPCKNKNLNSLKIGKKKIILKF